MLAFLREVVHAEYHDFLFSLVNRVIDYIGVTRRDEFADALLLLPPAKTRKQYKILQTVINV